MPAKTAPASPLAPLTEKPVENIGHHEMVAALDHIMERIRSMVVPPAPWSIGVIARHSDVIIEIEELANAHIRLRAAQALAYRRAQQHRREGQPDPDIWANPYAAPARAMGIDNVPPHVGVFFDCHTFPELAAGIYQPTTTTAPRPGPTDPTERLVWLARTPDAEPWVPTPDEQDQRFRELVAHIADVRRGRHSDERVMLAGTRAVRV